MSEGPRYSWTDSTGVAHVVRIVGPTYISDAQLDFEILATKLVDVEDTKTLIVYQRVPLRNLILCDPA